MRLKILRTDAELNIIQKFLDTVAGQVEVRTTADDKVETLTAAAAEFQPDVILTCYAPVTGAVIEAAPDLKAVLKYGVGINAIDVATATRRGVVVANCPDYGSDTVADHAFALMMALMRLLKPMERLLREDSWVWPGANMLGSDIGGKTIALLGLGRIGRAMARRTLGFNMRRLAYDPYVNAADVADLDVEFVSFETLIEQADVLSVHCVLTPETQDMIGASEFRSMKREAVLINVSRAHIVNEQALLHALRSGEIGGAGFDVMWEEPVPRDHPMRTMDNAIVTPHLAWYTREAFQRCERQTFARLEEILRGEVPMTICNPRALQPQDPS